MNTIERMQAFEELIRQSEEEQQILGTGNPLAPILIIGKESAADVKNEEAIQKHICANVKAVKDCFYNCDLVNLYLQPRPKHAGSTWNIYQKLIDYILYDGQQQREMCSPLPFGVWSYITEMNNTASCKTKNAADRLRPDYFRHRFFMDFPVVILACSNYIQNTHGNWQINDIFQVTYDLANGEHSNYSQGNWFYTHRSCDGRRLVIHTRQLSMNVSDDMLRDMANVIRGHLLKWGKFPLNKARS